MSNVGNSLEVPNYIKASSPQGLFRSMLLNNIKNGKRYKYQDIQFVNGAWYAWYYMEISTRDMINESVKEQKQIKK